MFTEPFLGYCDVVAKGDLRDPVVEAARRISSKIGCPVNVDYFPGGSRHEPCWIAWVFFHFTPGSAMTDECLMFVDWRMLGDKSPEAVVT